MGEKANACVERAALARLPVLGTRPLPGKAEPKKGIVDSFTRQSHFQAVKKALTCTNT